MRARMRTQSDRLGGRTGAGGIHKLSVFLTEAVKIRGVQRVVRHTREVRLSQIDNPAAADRFGKLGKSGQDFSVINACRPGGYRREPDRGRRELCRVSCPDRDRSLFPPVLHQPRPARPRRAFVLLLSPLFRAPSPDPVPPGRGRARPGLACRLQVRSRKKLRPLFSRHYAMQANDQTR